MANDGVTGEPAAAARGSIPPLSVESIDIFVTYRCALRCKHCFMGGSLDHRTDFAFDLYAMLASAAHSWDTKEFTFLGGEPTLYPRLSEAIELAQQSGYRTRVVTNGHRSYSRFLRSHVGKPLPVVCFSMDGSSPETHDKIRGPGSFSMLVRNVEETHARGATVGGILSVARENAHDVARTLRLCDALGFEFLNVHYVTNRGFAQQSSVLSVDEWRRTCATIDALASSLAMNVRLERTFINTPGSHVTCAVRERSNLMFLPDQRVYMCMMFIDVPGSHSFLWTKEGLVSNPHLNSEQRLAQLSTATSGCPAIGLVNRGLAAQASANDLVVNCIYEKEQLLSIERSR